MGTINAASLAAMNLGLKVNYAPIAKDLIAADFPFFAMFKERKDFEIGFGGRSMLWSLVTDRAHNAGVRDETGFEPGFSSSTNDDIDRVTPVEASVPRAYAYANTAATVQQMAKAHKKFEQFKDWGLGKFIQDTQDDLGMLFERMALNDKTGMLGTVVSVSLSGGNTVVVLQPASTINRRGIAGTQRLAKNQKVSIVRAGDWATSARLSRIHSNIGNSGTPMQKVVAVSDIHDMSAAPTVTLSGDLISAGTALAAGDIIIEGMSREANAAGGQSGTEALLAFDGLYSYVDQGGVNGLTTTLYGLTRSTYPALNSKVDHSSAARPLTWQLLQKMFDGLTRRRGNEAKKGGIESEYMLFAERGVRTAYATAPGEGQKEYIQEAKGKTMVGGFADVMFAFLGNDRPVPFVGYNTVPYGHVMLLRPKSLNVMWDVPPGPIDDDGLTLRKVDGKPVFTYEMQAYGNFRHQDPWLDGLITGVEGVY